MTKAQLTLKEQIQNIGTVFGYLDSRLEGLRGFVRRTAREGILEKSLDYDEMFEVIKKLEEIISIQTTTLRDLRHGLFGSPESVNGLIDETLEKIKQLMDGHDK